MGATTVRTRQIFRPTGAAAGGGRRPSNPKLDVSYRKLKVQLIEPGTDKPLIIRDHKNKELKYNIIAREGYTARRPVE